MSNFKYVTPDGQPPLGGLPPNVHTAMRTQARESLPPYTPNPQPTVMYVPRPIVGAIPGWMPWTSIATALSIQNVATTATTTAAATAPAPSPSVEPNKSKESQPPLPPGAHIPGTTDTPLVLPSGLGYIFPPSHTTLHLIEPEFAPFNTSHPSPPRAFQFRAFMVPTGLTIADLIEQICIVNNQNPPDGKKPIAKGIVECIELGNGKWLRGAEFWVGKGKGEDGKMRKKVGWTVAESGWDESRGTERAKPVWVATTVVYGDG